MAVLRCCSREKSLVRDNGDTHRPVFAGNRNEEYYYRQSLLGTDTSSTT